MIFLRFIIKFEMFYFFNERIKGSTILVARIRIKMFHVFVEIRADVSYFEMAR